MASREQRTRSVWAWVFFVLAVVLIWSHWRVVGHSLPEAPGELVTTTTAFVIGLVPYVVIDAAGVAPQWPGLALGLAGTAGAAYALARLLRWIDRNPQGDSADA